MNRNDRCRREFTFRFGDCDIYKRASVYSIMKFLTELSGEDYELKGLGHTFLWERGQTFLVTRMRLEFPRLPEYTETAFAETWERTVKGPYFYRDYDVRSKDGGQLIIGTSMWLLVDPVSRDILRPAALIGGLPRENPDHVPCADCKRLKLDPSLPPLGRRPIYYSDLDANGHVNNATYGKIAVDFMPEALRERPVKVMDMTFAMETKPDETIELRGGETEKGFAVQGVVGDTLHFACEFEF